MIDPTRKLESVVRQAMANDTDPVTQYLTVARTIVKALPDMVQPLEWGRVAEDNGVSAVSSGCVYYALDDGYWYVWLNGGHEARGVEYNLEGAKKRCESHRTAQIMKALGVSDE